MALRVSTAGRRVKRHGQAAIAAFLRAVAAGIKVRDSKNAARSAVVFRPAIWQALTTQMKSSRRP